MSVITLFYDSVKWEKRSSRISETDPVLEIRLLLFIWSGRLTLRNRVDIELFKQCLDQIMFFGIVQA